MAYNGTGKPETDFPVRIAKNVCGIFYEWKI